MSQPRFSDGEVRVIGSRWSPRTHEIKDFLSRSRVPFRWYDTERDPDARALAERSVAGATRYPIVLFPDGAVLVEPDARAVAAKLGLDTEPDAGQWDLIVVGGGPAGISASIIAASEGLRTVVLEQNIPGGQASYSACIENYPGFPEAMSGSELARRTAQQAERFGVEIVVTRRVTRLRPDGLIHRVTLDDGTELIARAVLLATGVSFRWLDAPGCGPLVGAGIYYGAAMAEASACREQEIYILGGGNSAGQAALLLAQYARRVTILTASDSLDDTMSRYLVERIAITPNIEVKTNATVVGAEGGTHLEWLTVQDLKTGETKRVSASGLFVFIGATPNTDWLADTVERDEEGFVVSGFDCQQSGGRPMNWPLDRPQYPLETNRAGVFVAGDVRKNSVKRLAVATGEGAMSVQFIHRHCAASFT